MTGTRTLSLRQARTAGLLAIAAVCLLQAINSFGCYGHSFIEMLQALLFVLPALLPAAVALLTRNPLRAVAACALFAPWLPFAFYVDCIRPYAGGGASMIYVAVLLYGFPCALLGALIGGPVSRWLGFRVAGPR